MGIVGMETNLCDFFGNFCKMVLKQWHQRLGTDPPRSNRLRPAPFQSVLPHPPASILANTSCQNWRKQFLKSSRPIFCHSVCFSFFFWRGMHIHKFLMVSIIHCRNQGPTHYGPSTLFAALLFELSLLQFFLNGVGFGFGNGLFGNDNASPTCSPNAALAAHAAFAPRFSVSNDEWDVWSWEPSVSNTNHNKFGTNYQSSRRQQNVLLGRSKRARFHAIRVSSHCTAEGPQWIRKISENEGPRFACGPGKWYDARLQSKQSMKQLHQNSGGTEKWEPSGPPKSICWHGTRVPLAAGGVSNLKVSFPIRTQLTGPNHFCATLLDKNLNVIPWSVVISEGFLSIQHKTHLRQLGHQTIQQLLHFHGRSWKKTKCHPQIVHRSS